MTPYTPLFELLRKWCNVLYTLKIQVSHWYRSKTSHKVSDLDLNKEVSEMFLEDWNVIVQVEQSLQKHFYLSTREGRKTQDVNWQDRHQNIIYWKNNIIVLILSLVPRLPCSRMQTWQSWRCGESLVYFLFERCQRWNCGECGCTRRLKMSKGIEQLTYTYQARRGWTTTTQSH